MHLLVAQEWKEWAEYALNILIKLSSKRKRKNVL